MSSELLDKYKIFDIGGRSIKEFDYVSHVAHIYDAYVIASDRVMKSGLIRDKSILNDTRLCVVWTSPNDWNDGYMYGRVAFDLPVENILNAPHFYWVEAMEEYNPTALRILVSENEIEDSRIVEFDPKEIGNPVYFENDTWYRLSKYNYEFMIARDIDLNECDFIDFVNHHSELCNKYGSSCSELGDDKLDASYRFVCYTLGLNDADLALNVNPKPKIQSSLNNAIIKIRSRLSSNCKGTNNIRDSITRAIVENALLAFSYGRDRAANNALKVLKYQAAYDALHDLIKRTYKIDIDED